MTHRAPLAVSLLGAIAVVVTASTVGMGAEDTFELAAIAVGAALAAGCIGAATLYLTRRRSVALQMTLVALTCVGAVAVGIVTAAQAMFLSSHDLGALVVTLVAAVSVGIVAALVLGRRVAAASASLEEATERIASGDFATSVHAPEPREFSRLAGRLQDMSRRLDEAQRKERAMEASRRELIAWISHDLRTPLAGIRAMVEALEDEVVDDPETIARYHRTIRTEAERLNGLVDDLFELSRINSGTLQLRLEQVPLADLVSDALAAAAGAAQAKGVKLEGRIDGALPSIELSAPEISRVLRNLLENAIRHTPEDGTVLVAAGAYDGRAFVSVNDTCGGIAEADIGRVFDVAFTGVPERSSGNGGSGLGLAIARGIVDAHEGEIAVENQGEGCLFTVTLPLRRERDE
jgi:signal transduction histidine kinase